MSNVLSADLDQILGETRPLWGDLSGGRIFIAGGTGFFGCWLLESFLWANERLALNAEAVVLARDPALFRKKWPHLAEAKNIAFHRGDIRSFAFPEGEMSHMIHAASPVSAQLNAESPDVMLDTIVNGTRHLLAFAAHCKAKRVLFTSSGAVYGKQPSEMTHISEEFMGVIDPMNPLSAHGEAKRIAELSCAIVSKQTKIECVIARCFAFVGPYLPLDIHLAMGNFIRDALAGGPIRLEGDGTPFRSYLYMSDLMVALWTLLFRGKSCVPYNVGSEEGLPLRDVAARVAKAIGPNIDVRIAKQPGLEIARYVPSTRLLCSELGFRQMVGLDDAIRKTAHWYRERA